MIRRPQTSGDFLANLPPAFEGLRSPGHPGLRRSACAMIRPAFVQKEVRTAAPSAIVMGGQPNMARRGCVALSDR